MLMVSLLVFLLLMTGCGNKEPETGKKISVYYINNAETKVVKREPKKDNQEQFMMCTTGEDIMSHTERVWGIDGRDINPFNEDK